MTENNNKDNSQKEITTSKKVSEPMDIVVGFQSGANRVQKDGGEVEYGREFLKVNDNAVYGREYVRYRSSNNQLTDEIKTDYKFQERNAKALENIVNGQKSAISQENFSQAEEKV